MDVHVALSEEVAARPKDRALAPLPVAARLFAELNAFGIPYCHWKSNWHLVGGLAGETDLDLLVDPDRRDEFEALLARMGIRRVLSPPMKSFPGLEDFLGFDSEIGGLIHLHVHYRLVLGEQRVKNHHLPVERWLLEDCRLMAGVKVPRPERELVLLWIRAHVKADLRSILRSLRGKQPHPVPDAIHSELLWLLGQADDREVLDALRGSGLALSAEELASFLERTRADRLSPWSVLKQKRSLVRQMRPYQRYPTVAGWVRKVEFRARYSRTVRRVWPLRKKVLPSEGVCVALVGADGSGKTTLAGDLKRWLDWKLETRWLYFGIARGDMRLKVLRKLRAAVSGDRGRGSPGGDGTRPERSGGRSVEALEWVYLARRRLGLDRKAHRLRDKGVTLIAERFPLREFWGMRAPMDGPRLSPDGPGTMYRALARMERRAYERIDPPDLVLVLRAGLETLRARKVDLDLETHRGKVEAVDGLAAQGRYRVLDAELPYPELLLEAKRAIWAIL